MPAPCRRVRQVLNDHRKRIAVSEADADQHVEHAQLARPVHRLDQRLVPVMSEKSSWKLCHGGGGFGSLNGG
jgi:hypothetical protein